MEILNTARNSIVVKYPGQGIREEYEPPERLSKSKSILEIHFSDMSRDKITCTHQHTIILL